MEIVGVQKSGDVVFLVVVMQQLEVGEIEIFG